MAQTLFNEAKIGEVIGEFNACNGRLQSAYENLAGAKDSVSKAWEGDAREKFITDMNEGLNIISQMITLLNNYNQAMETIKGNFVQTEQNNVNLI